MKRLYKQFVMLLRRCTADMRIASAAQVPDVIGDDECLMRNLYTPMHVEAKKNGPVLRDAAFIPPKKQKEPPLFSNEISTLRTNYTNAQFCKKHGQNIASGRKPIGFAVIQVGVIRALQPVVKEVKATPLIDRTPPLPMHADIVYNFTPQEGQPIPGEIKAVFKKIAREHACLYQDPKPDSLDWQGPEPLIFPCKTCVRCHKNSAGASA